MRISRGKAETLEFGRIEPIEAELLKQIPTATEGEEDPNVTARLYPDPAGGTEKSFSEDWAELVRPELEHLFVSSRRLVRDDLAQIKEGRGGLSSLSVPLAHADAWLSALNQARLALAAKHQFTEEELLRYELPIVFSRRDLVLLQINFYAAIQERLIEALEDRLR